MLPLFLLPYLELNDSNTLRWRHNGHDGVSDHQPHDGLLNRLSRRRSKKISKLRVTSLCAGNSPETGEFPAQMANNAENVSISWRHHEMITVKFKVMIVGHWYYTYSQHNAFARVFSWYFVSCLWNENIMTHLLLIDCANYQTSLTASRYMTLFYFGSHNT